MYQTAYFYDVWDLENQHYLHQNEVESIVSQLGLNYVPVLYKGEFISWDHVTHVKKLVDKMVGKGIIPENWEKRNLGTISKSIGSVVYEDCLREEPEIVELVGNEAIRKICTVPAMIIVKSLLSS